MRRVASLADDAETLGACPSVARPAFQRGREEAAAVLDGTCADEGARGLLFGFGFGPVAESVVLKVRDGDARETVPLVPDFVVDCVEATRDCGLFLCEVREVGPEGFGCAVVGDEVLRRGKLCDFAVDEDRFAVRAVLGRDPCGSEIRRQELVVPRLRTRHTRRGIRGGYMFLAARHARRILALGALDGLADGARIRLATHWALGIRRVRCGGGGGKSGRRGRRRARWTGLIGVVCGVVGAFHIVWEGVPTCADAHQLLIINGAWWRSLRGQNFR